MTLAPESTLGAALSVAVMLPGHTAEEASLCERPDISCLLLTTVVDASQVRLKASQAIGIDLPAVAGAAQIEGGTMALWHSPRSWLLLGPVNAERTRSNAIDLVFADRSVSATPYSDFLCWLELTGSRSLELLRQHSFVSLERHGLPVGHAKRGLIADIPAVVIHQKEQAWLIGVERSRAASFVAHLMPDYLKSSPTT
jgi:heterotetrameric sarcosine oxidase gamma subunit